MVAIGADRIPGGANPLAIHNSFGLSTIRMPDAESPIQAGIACCHGGSTAIAEIERPAFAILLPRRRTPLPAGELDRSLDAICALTIGAPNQPLQVVDGWERPIVESAERQVPAVPLRLDPTEPGAVIGSRPHQVRIGIDPIIRLAGALARRSP